jgi:hypothetical protein
LERTSRRLPTSLLAKHVVQPSLSMVTSSSKLRMCPVGGTMTFPSYGISKGIPVRFCSAGTYICCALAVGDVSRFKELVIAANSRRRILAFSKPPGKVSKTNRIILIQG